MRITQRAFSHTHGEYEFHPSVQASISPVNDFEILSQVDSGKKWKVHRI